VPGHNRERRRCGSARAKQGPTGDTCLIDPRTLPSSLHRPTFPKSQLSTINPAVQNIGTRAAHQ